VIDRHAAVGQHPFQVAVADRELQVPAHRPQDHLGRELPTLEWVLLGLHHTVTQAAEKRRVLPDIWPVENAATEPGELLQVLVIALIFGFGLLALKPHKRVAIEAGLNTISTAFFEFIHIIMRLAPIGTFGAVAYAVGSNGTAVLISLAYFVLSFYALIILFIVVVLGGICAAFRISLRHLLTFIRDEIVIMLGTASSESVLPRLLEKLPAYGVSKQTVGLVLPTGYAFNLDGTSLFMSMSVIFLAAAYGVPLSWEQELGILAIMLLTSKGAATVSGGSFVVFAATVTTSGILPVDGLALIFGVYRFLSIALSTCNVIGNTVATVVVAKLTGEFEKPARTELPTSDGLI